MDHVLKKWKKLSIAPKDNNSDKKSIKFPKKKTLSFSNTSSSSSSSHEALVPKGFLAVCVGDERKRFVIPTEYLYHESFGVLLREAEEEYGFQQEGVLRIPCEVASFERVMEVVEKKEKEGFCYGSMEVESEMSKYRLPAEKMMCR
ncbi:auxin-induced protein 6B-like [Canna indica]|uniref:Auxin-induced protein 6B-like n=1 Tax=Canna indica TaxID=4628 RepID=A0AAQ3Q0C8_9LILI|nr:auxin-induced protein 6B-like [Canna indica]